MDNDDPSWGYILHTQYVYHQQSHNKLTVGMICNGELVEAFALRISDTIWFEALAQYAYWSILHRHALRSILPVLDPDQ